MIESSPSLWDFMILLIIILLCIWLNKYLLQLQKKLTQMGAL